MSIASLNPFHSNENADSTLNPFSEPTFNGDNSSCLLVNLSSRNIFFSNSDEASLLKSKDKNSSFASTSVIIDNDSGNNADKYTILDQSTPIQHRSECLKDPDNHVAHNLNQQRTYELDPKNYPSENGANSSFDPILYVGDIPNSYHSLDRAPISHIIQCDTSDISMNFGRNMLAPFYHGSFEFYGPYNRGLLVDSSGYPLLSINEWRDLLTLVNSPSLTEDVPKKLAFFRKLACLSFSLLLCGIGFFFLIPLYITAKSYEKAFFAYALRIRLFLDTCSEGFSKRGLVFKLVRSSDPALDADLSQDPYDLCISVSLATAASRRSFRL